MSKVISLTDRNIDGFNSCRFCPSGEGKNKIFDAGTKESFHLCDAHLAEYQQEHDDITSNIVTRAVIAAKEAAALEAAALSPLEETGGE